MKKLLISSIAISIITLPITARADLGDAEQPAQQKFDAWCGRVKNNCKVTFEGSKMTVNGGQGIRTSQVKKIWLDHEKRGFWDRTPGNYFYPVYYITYAKEDGSIATGKFLFINEKAGSRFWNALQQFSQMNDPLAAIKEQVNDAKEAGSANRFNDMLNQTTQQIERESMRQQNIFLQMEEQRQRQQVIDNMNRPINCDTTVRSNGNTATASTRCN